MTRVLKTISKGTNAVDIYKLVKRSADAGLDVSYNPLTYQILISEKAAKKEPEEKTYKKKK